MFGFYLKQIDEFKTSKHNHYDYLVDNFSVIKLGLRKFCDKQLKEIKVNIVESIQTLKANEEMVLPADTSTHSISISFKKEEDGSLTGKIYNGGYFMEKNSTVSNRKILPFIIKGINPEIFNDEKRVLNI